VSASKRPSTSSLRRFITSRAYVPVAELRRRFALDEPDAMTHLRRNGTSAWIGLPEREAAKIQELWDRDELGVELSVEVRAPVVVGVYPMRIARYLTEYGNGNMAHPGNGVAPANGNGHAYEVGESNGNGSQHRPWGRRPSGDRSPHPVPRPMRGAPSYGSGSNDLTLE
jgi:hypothetical protein